eukprot:4358594-Prymnesium_polylepis.4
MPVADIVVSAQLAHGHLSPRCLEQRQKQKVLMLRVREPHTVAQPLDVLLQRGLVAVIDKPHARELVAHDTQARPRCARHRYPRGSECELVARDLDAVQPAALAVGRNRRAREHPQQPLRRRARRAAEHIEQRQHRWLVVALEITPHRVGASDPAHSRGAAAFVEYNVQREAVVPLFAVHRRHALGRMLFCFVARLERRRHAIPPQRARARKPELKEACQNTRQQPIDETRRHCHHISGALHIRARAAQPSVWSVRARGAGGARVVAL